VAIINVNGAHLYYEQYGTGEEIVISSAMGFTGDAYPELLAQEPTKYRVYTVQVRGFGQSSRVETQPEQGWLAQWADDVCGFADALGIDRFIYTGISHGGGIGWYIAARHPERLKALVSVVGTPHERFGTTDSSESRRKIIEGRNDPALVREQMELIAGPTDDPDRIPLREAMLDLAVEAHMSRDDDESKINQGMPFPEAKTNEELEAVLRSVTVPVLILGGMRDGVISPESSILAGRSVKKSKTILFEDEGHFMGRESPERLIREVKVYVDELNGTALPLKQDFFAVQGAGTI
jgi:pimeloyl-ACP methyl ester carboxylesterase